MQASKETCKKIKDSFLALCAADPTQKIKVKEIMEQAGLSKSTFYLNYENISSMLTELIDDIAVEVAYPFYRKHPGENPLFLSDTCNQFITNLFTARETILILKTQGVLPALIEQIYFFVHRAITNRLRLDRCLESDIPGFAELLSRGLLHALILHLETAETAEALLNIGKNTELLLCRLLGNN